MTDTMKTPRNGKARGGAGLPVRDDLFDEVWGMVQQMVQDALTQALPTMGTVVGRDGGGVRVNMDEEGVDRQVGFPRAKGVDYQPGDRVKVHQVKGGERVIDGVYTSDSNEQAVDSAQLRDKAVTNRALAGDSVDTGNLKDRSVTGGKLDSGLENKINDAVDKNQLDNTLSKYAQKSDIPDTSKFAKQDDLQALERRVKRLEDKKKP